METGMIRRLGLASIGAAILSIPAAAGAQEAMRSADVERAVLPLPVAQRAGATVMVVEDNEARVVREGDGPFICLADAPGDDRFQAVCYHESLEPYMARGRELRKGGMSMMDAIAARDEEIEAGTLEMPSRATLHQVLGGADWDGDLSTAQRLTVIYLPFATTEDLGLPQGNTSGPWLMHPGKGTAHIMIMTSG
jgi:hypothetical protein